MGTLGCKLIKFQMGHIRTGRSLVSIPMMCLGMLTTVRVLFDSTTAAQLPAGDTGVQMTFSNK